MTASAEPFLMTVERSEFSVSKSDGPFEGIKITVADFDLFCIEIEIDGYSGLT